MVEVSKAKPFMAQALDYRATRQDMIASNIANADTPFYKSRDIDFEHALAKKRAEVYGDKSNELKMAKTSSAHIEASLDSQRSNPTIFFRDGHSERNDGNSVDIDVETSEMSKNNIMYNAIIMANKKSSMMFKDMLASAGKI
ncbi:MAG: flagellar basal body rod protein FlgB [Campylobacterota bacterium]|nr:flagellar basal body rod protein FlgB [Campylobacterota bacterium]